MTALESPTIPLDVRDEGRADDPESGVAADFALLDAVAEGRAPPTLRLWENWPCLVVSRRDSRLPGFETARRQLAAEGRPVIVRGSGGTAVPHGPGVLLIGLAYAVPARTSRSIEDGYRRICALMAAGLGELGINAACRPVPAAFCDGRYNLAVGERKIAGTAQRWRRGQGEQARQAVLAHALLFVDGDPGEMTAAVNRFYALAGAETHYDPAAVTTLAEELTHSSEPMTRLRRALIAAAGERLQMEL